PIHQDSDNAGAHRRHGQHPGDAASSQDEEQEDGQDQERGRERPHGGVDMFEGERDEEGREETERGKPQPEWALLDARHQPLIDSPAPDLRMAQPGGAGTMTWSIESANPSSLTSTTAPITQTSSSAVSKRTGIWVISDSRACSGLTPRTLVREP